ncbi:MAG: carbon-nitrogen hydrolase family protein [Bacteroidetes bacterium]|nr:carbon-nitrogen hydrolase family protein [Bacteroidota bacterium]MBU1373589.1 carbon-nitrogen hydrolase family protein [Bacteroidota bacterium]MBU1486400.1 carbon-nitrogen hydrolase family protein [Bacteroidota bacterium]MBU1759637.1 carbon-nitrogen hydrolase family protein [Bacteroidota bacterium]MBU2045204.1 carbon-nitrogen hydrolase family protein [Bacteroidota bacterium]
MKPFAIAGIQMKVSAVASNVEMMKLKIDITMNLYPWIEMIMFSELCAYGPLTHTAQVIPNNFEAEMQTMAKKYGIWLLPGSIFEHHVGKIYNTATVINPEGEIVTRYRKMFPFYPYEVGVTPGDSFCVFDVPGVARFGLSICYDMWFPETTRTLVSMGAEVIMHPTMSGTIDREIELSIVRAMASVNQCYFFDINGLDTGGCGRSIICGPDGRVLHQSEGTEEIIPLELNIDRVQRSRELGILRLGQPLKSFRDHLKTSKFDIYHHHEPSPYLASLGPLIKPSRLDKLTELKFKENTLEQITSSVPFNGENLI